MSPDTERRGIDKVLNLFTEVRPGEATTALLLALNVFLILMAYYVLKPVREALILGEGSAELKSYLSAGQVAVLALVVPIYGRLVARYPRMRLINVVTLFFAACPVAFYVLAKFGVPLAVVFFVWIGIFSLMIIAQFWSFANDVYTKDEGERLFVIVGFGASLGAVAGARIADRLIEPIGIHQLMLLGAAILAGQLWLTNRINTREAGRARPAASRETPAKATSASGPLLRAGVPHALSAVDRADVDAGQLGQQHRRVHPRQHREGIGRRSRGLRPQRRPDRRAADRRLLLQILHLRERTAGSCFSSSSSPAS